MSTHKTEYILTYYWKDGFTYKVTGTDYDSLLSEASVELNHNRDVIDYYEITEAVTATSLVKSSK